MGAPGYGGDGATQRQVVKFSFYKVDPAWRLLPAAERELGKRQAIATVEAAGDRMLIGSYSLVGIRGEVDFLLWQVADQVEEFQWLATRLLGTALGPYLTLVHSFLSMTRRSIYKTPKEPAKDRTRVEPGDAKYLFVYPFVKTRAWYELSKDERQEMMNDHITIGRKYPSVKLNTTYSYGLDDQEFVVAFESDTPADFLDLVMELRETKASSYTLRDTPAFTCLAMPMPEVLDSLGDAASTPVADASADGWAPVAALRDAPEGSATVVYFRGEQVALFNVGGRVYAVGNRCSHANGPLAEGRVEGTCVTCPWHDSQFDLTTGEPLGGPAVRRVPAYDVKVDDGQIFLSRAGAEAPHLA